jgi:hypothetical protein
MTPPVRMVIEGASPKQTHTQVMASGVSGVFRNAFSAAEIS